MLGCMFFFFKQKTAYEIVPCDWSSDVCSSDLRENLLRCVTAFNPLLAPNDFLHALVRLDPGATGLAPARRTCDGFFEAKLVGKRGGIFEGLLPFWRHVHQALVYELRRMQGGIEVLEPANSDTFHPLEIQPDPLFRDVAIHPVPPDAGFGGGRWIPEAIFKRSRRALTENLWRDP